MSNRLDKAGDGCVSVFLWCFIGAVIIVIVMAIMPGKQMPFTDQQAAGIVSVVSAALSQGMGGSSGIVLGAGLALFGFVALQYRKKGASLFAVTTAWVAIIWGIIVVIQSLGAG